MSTIQSAVRMVSSSCSTTMRVLPRFLSLISVSMSRRLSRWCSPIGLVEHVQHAGETRPDLGRQADALRLSTGERGRRAREVQVAEPDLDQELEPQPDLAQHLGGDLRLAVGELELRHELVGVGEAQARDLGDVGPCTSTASTSGLSRLPSQTGHGTSRR